MQINQGFKLLTSDLLEKVRQYLKETKELLQKEISVNSEYKLEYSAKIYDGIIKFFEAGRHAERFISIQDITNQKNHKFGPCGYVVDLLDELLVHLGSLSFHDQEYYQTNILPKAQHLDEWLWAIIYSRDYDNALENWLANDLGRGLSTCIKRLELNILYEIENLPRYEDFFVGFADPNRADINIVSIGCDGHLANQQVYPWVHKLAAMHPELTIKIDLFDYFAKAPIVINNNNDWQKVDSNMYRHTLNSNIILKINPYCFPLSESGFIAGPIYPLLMHCVQRLLRNNKIVIFSQHTGDNSIDLSLVNLSNELKMHMPNNIKNLFLVGECGWPAEIYNENYIDAIERALNCTILRAIEDKFFTSMQINNVISKYHKILRDGKEDELAELIEQIKIQLKTFVEKTLKDINKFLDLELIYDDLGADEDASLILLDLIKQSSFEEFFVWAHRREEKVYFSTEEPLQELDMSVTQMADTLFPNIMRLYREWKQWQADKEVGENPIDKYLESLNFNIAARFRNDAKYVETSVEGDKYLYEVFKKIMELLNAPNERRTNHCKL